MLKFEVDPGNKRVFAQINELEDRTRRGIRQFWFQLGKNLQKSFNEAVLKKPRSGRIYKRRIKGGRLRRHTASKAGESPANRSGEYRKAVGFQIRGEMEMQFGNASPYAGFLENGTSKMRARPGLGNAVNDTEGESLSDAANSIERELTRP